MNETIRLMKSHFSVRRFAEIEAIVRFDPKQEPISWADTVGKSSVLFCDCGQKQGKERSLFNDFLLKKRIRLSAVFPLCWGFKPRWKSQQPWAGFPSWRGGQSYGSPQWDAALAAQKYAIGSWKSAMVDRLSACCATARRSRRTLPSARLYYPVLDWVISSMQWNHVCHRSREAAFWTKNKTYQLKRRTKNEIKTAVPSCYGSNGV